MEQSNISIQHTKLTTEKFDRFSLIVDGVNVGKCIIEKQHCTHGSIWLKYIEIYEKYRCNDYSTKLWNLVENWLKEQQVKEIYLYTSEFAERQGKLEKLYNRWGFNKLDRPDIYEYNGDDLMRKVIMKKVL